MKTIKPTCKTIAEFLLIGQGMDKVKVLNTKTNSVQLVTRTEYNMFRNSRYILYTL